MTNIEIINKAMLQAGLNPLTTIVDSYAGWNRRNYSIRQGEKAAFNARIWMPVKNKDDGEKLIMVTASFFTEDQVMENSS